MNNNQPNIPEELQKELTTVLQKLCIFIHEQAQMSHVVVNIFHLSDALGRASQTEMIAGVGGAPVRRADGPPAEKAPVDKAATEAMVNNLVNDLMARAKGVGQKKDTEGGV